MNVGCFVPCISANGLDPIALSSCLDSLNVTDEGFTDDSLGNVEGLSSGLCTYYTKTLVQFRLLSHVPSFYGIRRGTYRRSYVRTVTHYYQRQCPLYFPEAFSPPPRPTVDAINSVYRGWKISIDNLFFANGKRKLYSLLSTASC